VKRMQLQWSTQWEKGLRTVDEGCIDVVSGRKMGEFGK